jgi:hypothetical protein
VPPGCAIETSRSYSACRSQAGRRHIERRVRVITSVVAICVRIDSHPPDGAHLLNPRRGSQGSGSARLGLSQKGGLPCPLAGRTFRTVQGHRLAPRRSPVAAPNFLRLRRAPKEKAPPG